jgi:putative DNA primase/helicase
MNIINPDLLARAANRIEEKPKSTTSDKDIVRRCKLLVDLDPERPTDVSSTDIEKEAAREHAEAILEYLAGRGWVAPVVADSGNGYHLLYPVDLPNDPTSLKLIEAVLKVLALQFGDDKVIVDIKVGNAARICKLYGTVSRKGDHTADRPHRLSHILEDPRLRPGEIVTLAQLEALASSTLPEEPKPEHHRRNGKSDFDLASWLRDHSVPVRGPVSYGTDAEKWTFERGADCLFGGGHDAGGGFVIRFASGAVAAGCHHNSCAGKTWADLREIYEPDYRDHRKGDHHHQTTNGTAKPQADVGPMEGELLGERIKLWENAPVSIAEAFLTNKAMHQGWRTVHRYQEDYYEWSGSLYGKRTDEEIEAKVAKFIYDDVILLKDKGKLPEEVPPNKRHVEETMRALRNRTHLKNDLKPPCWLAQAPPADLNNAITVQNGILLPATRTLLDPSPAWFTLNALDVDYNESATCPMWEQFLLELWPNDQQSIVTVQDIGGYLLNGDMSQEKIFMFIGPVRSGKGTIAALYRALLGKPSTASLSLSALSEGFERQELIGKSLAVVGDARLGAKTDTARLLDLILTISGRDNPSIPRKYKDAYTGPVNVRFLVLSNEVPRFPDPAAASRSIVVKTIISFLGREDVTLKDKLLTELSGILNWTLDGWERLQERGHFIQPQSALDEVDTLARGGGAVPRFVQDECVVGAKESILKDDLYKGYRGWCEDQHEDRPLSYEVFVKQLKEAFPVVRDYRPKKAGQRLRFLMGIRLVTNEEKTARLQEEENPDAAA